MLGHFWKLYDGKFFRNYMLGNFAIHMKVTSSWKDSDGKFGWIPAAFLRGNYGTMLRYRTTVSRQWYLERR